MVAPIQPQWQNEPTCWDLTDLYRHGPLDPRLELEINGAESKCEEFAARWKGLWNSGRPVTAEKFATAITEYQSLLELLDRPLIFAQLNHAASTLEPERGALLARAREARTRALNHLIFFEMEWGKVDGLIAGQLMASDQLRHFGNWLEKIRKRAPHFLTEAEEKIAEVKNLSGKAAFNRLFDELVGRLSVSILPAKDSGSTSGVPLQEALNQLYLPDRDQRRKAAEGISQTLQKSAPTFAFILNSLVLDHQEDCRLRRHSDPMEPRNLENEIDPLVVRALMESVEGGFGLVERHYRLKGQLLGLDDLQDFDRYAPMATSARTVTWPEACEMVCGAYSELASEAGDLARVFLTKNWVDAMPRKGKRGGAFSAGTVTDAHPYILMSYHGSARDVATLAHELGHGIHQHLSRGVGYLQSSTPLTTAEMASVFGEMLLFEKLVQTANDDRERLFLHMGKVEDAIATVFRQVVLTRFEMEVHSRRKDQGELSVEGLNQLWLDTNQRMFGDSVRLGEGYKWWWAYIGHFIHSPFYCYSYAFGELLVLSLFHLYKQHPKAFAKDYLRVLSLGGSRSPVELMEMMGINIQDASFWSKGLSLLDGLQRKSAELAASLG